MTGPTTAVAIPTPLVRVSAGVDAPVERVFEAARAAEVLRGGIAAGAVVAVPAPAHDGDAAVEQFDVATIHVSIDRRRRTIAFEGQWWYRGEYTFEPSGDRTTVMLAVYNVARHARWLTRFILWQYRRSGALSREAASRQLAGYVAAIEQTIAAA